MIINSDITLSAKELVVALMNLKKGERLLYHRGFLPKDREKRSARGKGVDLTATVAFCLAQEKRVELVQELHAGPPKKIVNELVPSYTSNTMVRETRIVQDWNQTSGVWNYVAIGSR